MNEAALSLWADGSRRMVERIDDTAQRITTGFPNFADPATGEWTTSPQGDWTGGHWIEVHDAGHHRTDRARAESRVPDHARDGRRRCPHDRTRPVRPAESARRHRTPHS